MAKKKATPGWDGERVGCPFFVHHTSLTVTCEGSMPDELIRRKFATEAACMECMGRYCCDKYRSCPHYKLAAEKY